MLVKSSLSNSINVSTSFASDFGKQHNMDLLCDLSQCGETWQKYPHCDIPQNIYRESLPTLEDENRLSNGILQFSRTDSEPSVSKDSSASSTPKMYGIVYRRRKQKRNMVVLSEENAEEISKENYARRAGVSSAVHALVVQKHDRNGDPPFIVESKHSLDSSNPSTSGELDLQKTVIPIPQTTYASKRILKPFQDLPNKSRYVIALPAEGSNFNRHKCAIKKRTNITEHGSAITKNGKIIGKCSSSDAIRVDTREDCTSTRELCTSVLKSQELVGLDTSNLRASSEVLSVITNTAQLCKACGRSENALKMLICDLCEEAFHVSCCNPKVKKLSLDIWYCQPCFKKKRKALRESIPSEDRNKKLRGRASPILLMLRHDQPYNSGARIGKDFQAEVPEWAGPTISDGQDYFGKPLEVDPTDCVNLPDWNADKSFNDSFIGNWIQCREVIDDNQKSEETICGKWRRAPLFVVQTDDWDCSCCLPWDSIHADCAVPQELETEVVLEHLKYIEMLRPQLAQKQRSESSKKRASS